jgi:hypothetical protein
VSKLATKPPPVTAWSYSRYADYKQCPAKFKYKHIMRLPDPGSPAMQRGNVIHKAAEDFLRGRTKKVHEDLANVKEQLLFLRDQSAVPEENWGFKRDWAWIRREGWFGDDVWLRAKTDVRLLYDDDTMLLIDWKTGKMYNANEEQIELFALAGFRRFPNVTEVDTRLLYTDVAAGENEIQRVYTQPELAAIQRDWERKVKPMFADRRFAPTPNDKCGWCPFTKAKGGPCKF